MKPQRHGGLALFRKYGREYMVKIGKRGAQVFHFRYKIVPVGTSGYAIVRRDTNIIKEVMP